MSAPVIKLRGESRVSKSGAWTPQQLLDLRAIWDDLFRSINGGVSLNVFTMPDGTAFTPSGAPTDINVQVNTQGAGNLTANAPVGTPADGQILQFLFKSAHVQTFVWNGIYKGCTTTALPTTTTGSGKTDRLFFQYNALSAKWELINAQYGYA